MSLLSQRYMYCNRIGFVNKFFKSTTLNVQFAPIASFLSWKPVVILSPKDAQLYLNSNANGSIWVLGPPKKGKALNLALKVRLDNSSSIFLDSALLPIFVFPWCAYCLRLVHAHSPAIVPSSS